MAASSAASMNRPRGWLAYRGDFHLRPTGQAINACLQVGLTVLGRPLGRADRPRSAADERDARPYLERQRCGRRQGQGPGQESVMTRYL